MTGALLALAFQTGAFGQTKDPARSWRFVPSTEVLAYDATPVVLAGRLYVFSPDPAIVDPDTGAISELTTFPKGSRLIRAVEGNGIQVAAMSFTFSSTGGPGPLTNRFSLVTSRDGLRWQISYVTTRREGSQVLPIILTSLVHNGEKFVAQFIGSRMESVDGEQWTQTSVPFDNLVVPRNSGAVRCGDRWYGRNGVSADGITWTAYPVDPPFTPDWLATDGGMVVAVGAAGKVTVTSDGTVWTAPQSIGRASDVLTWAGDRFLLSGTAADYFESVDGVNWSRIVAPVGTFPQRVVAVAGKPAGLASDGSLLRLSTDGWRRVVDRAEANRRQVRAFACAGEIVLTSTLATGDPLYRLYAGSAENPFATLVAADTTAPVAALAMSPGGRYVAGFGFGVVRVSDGGAQWSTVTLPASPSELVWLAGRFVGVGGNTLFASSDGLSWTTQSADVRGLQVLGSRCFASSDSGTALRPKIRFSDDGFAWRDGVAEQPNWSANAYPALSIPTFARLGSETYVATSVRYFNSHYPSGQTAVFRSPDSGATWSVAALLEGTDAKLLASGNGLVLRTSSADEQPIYRTENGTAWARISAAIPEGVQVNGDTMIGRGSHGLQIAHFILPRPGLSGLSTRGFVGTGDAAMIAGFVITGDRPRHTLLRASGGATLGDYGVRGTLADPAIELVRIDGPSAGTVATNDNWRDAANADEIAAVAQRLGEFPFPAGSTDAALTLSLEPGVYTLVVRGRNGATGVALAEVYDADASPDDTSDRRIVALSTRLNVKTGDAVAISGLIVQGTRSKQMLLRGLGPELARLGVSGALRQPRLLLHRVVDGVEVLQHTANRWADEANAPDLAIAFDECGVSAIPVASDDSAMLVELQPGAYTIHLQSQDGSAGNGLIEAYEVR